MHNMNPKASGTEDKDRLFLEEVLDKLYDFGDGPASKKKLKPQKKKKRKRSEEEEEDEEPSAKDVCSDTEDSRTERLGVTWKQQPSKTDNSKAKYTAVQQSQMEVVTFQDPTKKPKTQQTSAPDKMSTLQTKEKKKTEQKGELSLEKARLEVHRFGITGYKKEQQRVFEQDRAVMLGARPPKKEYVNYKMLQEQIKEKKQRAKEEVHPDLKKKKKQTNQRNKKKTADSGSSSALSGQVGRFKNGMLILSSKEIQKIKGSRRSK